MEYIWRLDTLATAIPLVICPENSSNSIATKLQPLSPTGSALARTDLSPLTNGNWVIHAEYSCFLHLPFLAKIVYIPQFKASNARVLDEISSGLARMKLQLLCGAYTLQSNRSAYNKTEVNPTCHLCDCGDEDLEHFILKCTYLEYTRNPITSIIEREVDSLLGKSSFEGMCDQKKLGVILDCTVLLEKPNIKLCVDQLRSLEFHTRRLLHNLTGVRYRILKEIPQKQC